MERCVTCHFYDRHNVQGKDGKATNAGVCRRAAPQLHPVNAKSYMIEGVWPTVRDDDRCGEWKALVRHVDPTRAQDPLATVASSRADGSPRATVISATPVQPPARPAMPASAGSATTFAFAQGRRAD